MSPPNASSDLRPLALGELIDRAAMFWRAHLKALFTLCLGFDLLNYIAAKVTALMLPQMVAMLDTRGTGDPLTVLREMGRFMGVSVAAWALIIWSYWLATATVARYAVPTRLGEPTTPADGFRRTFARVGTLTGAYVISIGWSMGATLVLCLPGLALGGLGFAAAVSGTHTGLSNAASIALLVGSGLLLALAFLASTLWYFLRFMLLPPVVALENLGAWGSFRRSGELLSGRIEPGFMGRGTVRAMVLSTVVGAMLIAVSTVAGLPVWIVRLMAGGNIFDPAAMAAIPQTLLVPAELFQVVAQTVFTPLGIVVSAFFYLDMRVRREGLDLERRLSEPATSEPSSSVVA
ncbi:hypothetical protein DRW03_30935 [Corallococcus sp. H22C18031201]|uniref:hypothetical protein n=1 Tax=Citreicoccus inhibens TaxID=2849499 RepID=UPI000E718743|nr:hypothetical protein [Citreicoccus inhibens]MBU8900187.1 hypothetical protein [Citreicoccus inhibens]RJS16355.1 hypothetical protein DRW03_30935 [Corallococcus sp. H22C18031201]